MLIGNELVTYLCIFKTKTYQTPSSKLRLLFCKALYINGFNRFAYFCFLLIFFHKKKQQLEPHPSGKLENEEEAEKTKVKAAIRTDFILSVEIVIIALSTVLDKDLTTQIITVAIISVLATIGVYGIVALIVRMDDAGLFLINKSKNKGFLATLGHVLVRLLPVLIKILGVVGTIALLLVSGGIFHHQLLFLHHYLPQVSELLNNLLLGSIGGLLVFGGLFLLKKAISLFKK